MQQQFEHDLRRDNVYDGPNALPPDVLVYAVEGPFFFGAAETFERALASTHTEPRVLIIRLRWVPFIDITGIQTLEEVITDLKRRHVHVILTGMNPRVRAKLEKAGVLDLVGPDGHFENLQAALAAVSSDSAGR